jgi:hypothetical protein
VLLDVMRLEGTITEDHYNRGMALIKRVIATVSGLMNKPEEVPVPVPVPVEVEVEVPVEVEVKVKVEGHVRESVGGCDRVDSSSRRC